MTDDDRSVTPPSPVHMPSLLIRRRFVLSRTRPFVSRPVMITNENTAPVQQTLFYPMPPPTPFTAPIFTTLTRAIVLTDSSYDGSEEHDSSPFTYDENDYPDEPPGLITDSDEDGDYEDEWHEDQLTFIAYWYAQLTIAALLNIVYIIYLLLVLALQRSCTPQPPPPPPPPPSWHH